MKIQTILALYRTVLPESYTEQNLALTMIKSGKKVPVMET